MPIKTKFPTLKLNKKNLKSVPLPPQTNNCKKRLLSRQNPPEKAPQTGGEVVFVGLRIFCVKDKKFATLLSCHI